MPQYLLLIYGDEARWEALPEAERDCLWTECEAYTHELKAGGHFIAGAPLERARTARTIRRSGGQSVITDGPFAETKEALGGYCLVVCQDLAEAVTLGERFPGLRVGMAVEARPLMAD